MWIAARTKDSETKKSATTSHTPSPSGIKEASILTLVKLVLWDTSPLLLSLLAFQIKWLFLATTSCFLIYWLVMW